MIEPIRPGRGHAGLGRGAGEDLEHGCDVRRRTGELGPVFGAREDLDLEGLRLVGRRERRHHLGQLVLGGVAVQEIPVLRLDPELAADWPL